MTVARLTGLPAPRDKHWHPYGVYCLFHIPRENRGAGFRPPSEMGIWVGTDPHVRGGARVVPISGIVSNRLGYYMRWLLPPLLGGMIEYTH